MKNLNKYSLLIGLLTRHQETINSEDIIFECATQLEGFSIIEQTGYWHSQREKSLVIYVIGTESEYAVRMEKLGKKLQEMFKQDSVYLTVEPVTVTDINSEYVPRETHNSKVTR